MYSPHCVNTSVWIIMSRQFGLTLLSPLLPADSLVSLSVMTDQCNIYVSNKSICILYGYVICYVLSNCMSVTNFRVGIHLQLGKCLCCLTFSAQGTVFVFKDIVFFSRNRSHYGKKTSGNLES